MNVFPHAPHRGATDVWLTPPHVLAAVGPFDLDPCAAGADYAWRPWETAARSYTHDGMARLWFGLVWLNPPYGPEAGAWLERLAAHGRGVALTLARTETDWFHKAAWARADGMLFLRGRLNFHHASGERAAQNCGAPPVLVGYGDEAMRRLARAPLPGYLVVLAPFFLTTADGSPVGTWREAIEAAAAGRALHVRDLYRAAEATPKVRAAKAAGHNWRAQLRRALQRHFRPLGGAVWSPA